MITNALWKNKMVLMVWKCLLHANNLFSAKCTCVLGGGGGGKARKPHPNFICHLEVLYLVLICITYLRSLGIFWKQYTCSLENKSNIAHHNRINNDKKKRAVKSSLQVPLGISEESCSPSNLTCLMWGIQL